MPLSHLRVVEIGSAPASSYCARLFADFGATVQKIEPPSGDPLRRRGPFTPKGASTFFAFLNFNKSSIVLEASDSAKLTEIVAGCDILIDGRDIDAANCPAIDLDALKRNNPGLIHVETSWFGHAGPYNGFKATDTTIRALVGLVKLIGPAEGPPSVGAPDFQTGIFGGLWGFIAAASSVLSRMHDGHGRTSKLSLYEASIAVTEYIMFEAFTRGDIMRRIGVNRFWPTFPVGIYKTRDGWLGVTTVTPAQWRAFCEMLDLIELRDDATLFLGVDRLGRKEEIEQKFVPKLAEKTTAEWFAQGLKRRIPLVPVPSIAELIANEEARSRGAIVPIEIGGERGFTVGSAQRLTGTPPRRGGKVPALGETVDGAKVATTTAPPRPTAPRDPKRLPLEGIRVVDFSMGWAGPICTRNLADLGADVIKIEAIQYPDWWRGVDRRPAYVQGREYEKVPRFCIMNRNKRGITLDLTQTDGRELAKRLIADADLVVDNYSVEVLPKLGLGYDVLHKLNPKLVVMSMSAFGSQSVNRDCRAYGSTLEQGSGLPSVVGRPEWAPTMSHTAFGDAIGGLNGCVAVLAALIHARRTGEGQFIDLSQIEAMMPFAAPWVIKHSIDGAEPTRYGNRHPDFAPHGVFRCAGHDDWIVVACSSDEMWPKLCALLNRDDWARDAAMATAAGRRAHEDTIEQAIEDWTNTREPETAMRELQAAGIAAGVARLPVEMLKDPQLHARGFIQDVERAFIGKHPQPSLPFREGERPFAIRFAPPTLGEYNEEILGGMLGLSKAELERLRDEDVIGTEMLMEEQLVKRSKQAAE